MIPLCMIGYLHLKKRAAEFGDVPLPEWALDPGPKAAVATKSKPDDRPAKYRPKKIKKRK
jgi:hypothetical protein